MLGNTVFVQLCFFYVTLLGTLIKKNASTLSLNSLGTIYFEYNEC